MPACVDWLCGNKQEDNMQEIKKMDDLETCLIKLSMCTCVEGKAEQPL